jgi:hypothetical protein
MNGRTDTIAGISTRNTSSAGSGVMDIAVSRGVGSCLLTILAVAVILDFSSTCHCRTEPG